MAHDIVRKATTALRSLLTRKVLINCDGLPYHFLGLPPRKLLNWALAETSLLARPAFPWAWPTHMQVEPSSLCNINCKFCPVATGMDRPTGQMDPALFERLIDEVGGYVFLILLWDWGEPFLNPAIYHMIAYARARGVKVISSTNGHIFAEGDHAERLIRSGIDTIIFAVDGISQDTYERYRGSRDLEQAIAGVSRVVEAKRRAGSESPHVCLRFLPMKHNEHELPRLRDFARSLRVDSLTIKRMNPFHGCEGDIERAAGLAYMPDSQHYRRFELDASGSPVRGARNPCKVMWNNPAIHWDGKVTLCSFDPHDRCTLGDLRSQSFRDIWRGAPYRRVRRQFRRRFEEIPLCRDCTYAFRGGSLIADHIAEAHFFNA
jgi:radical SAM protein with 4Fe4S-binding SPASM domain